ncbi:PepSY domain-containing protein [Streptacidiphilus melanogenes]|uniref:PepSY domain-containing protein n=1 Tax=Streptacidiphilus melanogenes TaxID=411235 RepID=UPI0005AADD7E|nr:PepSY domain-containing protein [Streptacidiphilus melanogenes]
MSDPFASGPVPAEPDEPTGHDGHGEYDEAVDHDEQAEHAEQPARRRGPVRRVVTGRRSRWVVGGVVAVVLVGGSAAVTAAVVHHSDGHVAVAVGPDGLPGLKRVIAQQAGGFGGGAVVVKGGQVVAVPGPAVPGAAGPLVAGTSVAPAPLPSLSADQAVTKAEAAVSGGKAESLATVPEAGGGTAWQVVVLGPDGVRHLLTLDGASGSVTSNTVTG